MSMLMKTPSLSLVHAILDTSVSRETQVIASLSFLSLLLCDSNFETVAHTRHRQRKVRELAVGNNFAGMRRRRRRPRLSCL